MPTRFRIVLAMLLAVCCSPAIATEYSALPFSAKVVDKETQRPVEGAIAITVWSLSYYTGHSGGPILNITVHRGSHYRFGRCVSDARVGTATRA